MAEFRCKTGECIECCTEPRLKIPVTLGDLYRECTYTREKTGKIIGLQDAYQKLCDGWMFLNNPEEPSSGLLVPKARMPCYHIDEQAKKCRAYDTRQYVACRSYPEEMFVEPPPGLCVDKNEDGFWDKLPCTKDVTISREREAEIAMLLVALQGELTITSMFLHNEKQPIEAKNQWELEKALNRKMACFNSYENFLRLYYTLKMNGVLDMYMKLFGIDSDIVDYAKSPTESLDDAYMLVTSPFQPRTIRRLDKKIGRNEPCPCGSGAKFKKCCGKC